MIDYAQYRSRTGLFVHSKSVSRPVEPSKQCSNRFTMFLIILLMSTMKGENQSVACSSSPSIHRYSKEILGSSSVAVKVRVSGVFTSNALSGNFFARCYNGNIAAKSGIKICHINVRSLKNKVDEVKSLISNLSPTVIGVSECELCNGVNFN